MDFLQARDDRPLSEWKQTCIKQLRSILLPEDTYELIDIPHFDNLTETVNESDRLRAKWLAKHPNGVWVDDDCFLNVRWQPETRGIVHLPINESAGQTDGPDIFLIYVNGDTDWIKRNMSDRARQSWIDRFVTPEFKKEFYGFPLEMTRTWSGYSFIPKSVYIHGYETITKELQRRKIMPEQQNQQQQNRHINDIVNEKMVALDGSISEAKSFINTLRIVINEQADKIAELENKIVSMGASDS